MNKNDKKTNLTDPTVQLMIRNLVKGFFERELGLEFSLSPQKAYEIESKLREWLPTSPREHLPFISYFLGLYLGMALIERIPGAQWNIEMDKSNFHDTVEVPTEVSYLIDEPHIIYPFVIAREFCQTREELLLVGFLLNYDLELRLGKRTHKKLQTSYQEELS